MGTILKSNSRIRQDHLEWFSCFPAPFIRQRNNPIYAQSLRAVLEFLVRMAHRWMLMTNEQRVRGFPLLMDELLGTLCLYSSVLQVIIFRASRRSLGVPEGPIGSQMDALFLEDQRFHRSDNGNFITRRNPADHAHHNNLIISYKALVAQVANARGGRQPVSSVSQDASPPIATPPLPNQPNQALNSIGTSASPSVDSMASLPHQSQSPSAVPFISTHPNPPQQSTHPITHPITHPSSPHHQITPSASSVLPNGAASSQTHTFVPGQYQLPYAGSQPSPGRPDVLAPRFPQQGQHLAQTADPSQPQPPQAFVGFPRPNEIGQPLPAQFAGGHTTQSLHVTLPSGTPSSHLSLSPSNARNQTLNNGAHHAVPFVAEVRSSQQTLQPVPHAPRTSHVRPAVPNTTSQSTGTTHNGLFFSPHGFRISVQEYPHDPYQKSCVLNSLHQAHLRSPRRVLKQLSTSSPERYYDFVKMHVLGPVPIPPQQYLHQFEFRVSNDVYSRISRPEMVPGELLPVSRFWSGSLHTVLLHERSYRSYRCP
jgi:zinc finger MIZ domain-containing protein